jgi:hypothetical protein
MEGIEIISQNVKPRADPKLIILGIIALLFGITFDCLIYPNETVTTAYLPLMLLIGNLSRFYISNLILAGFATILLEYASTDEFVMELFLLRWMGYFLIAFIVQTLIRNNRKEQENLIHLTLALAGSLDARDNYTAFHSKNVAYYSYETKLKMFKQTGVLLATKMPLPMSRGFLLLFSSSCRWK